MKNLKIIIILLVLIGCNKTPKKLNTEIKSVKTDFNSFPTAWQRLTKINDELILYFPCKGGDRSIQFSTLSNGDMSMSINYNEQYFNFIVREFNKKRNGYTLKVVDRKSNEPKTFYIENYGGNNNLSYWNWENNGIKNKFLFTPFNVNNKYPVVHQPCKECPEVPCEDNETVNGKYEVTLPYRLSLDGNDYRELSFTIAKDSSSLLEIYYYPENENVEGELIEYKGKVKIDSTYFIVQFENFDTQLLEYFNPKKESKLEYLDDKIFRFRKTVKGLIIDDSFCENWEMNKYKN